MLAMLDGRVVAQGAPAEIMTSALVRTLYGVESTILTDPVHGTPVVCPTGLAAGPGPAADGAVGADDGGL